MTKDEEIMELFQHALAKTDDRGMFDLWVLLTSYVGGRLRVSAEELIAIVNDSAHTAKELNGKHIPSWREKN